MTKVILKYEAAVLKEIPLKQSTLTIGRTAANDLTIDNLAVSGHHAKLYFEGDKFWLEDLNSLNGTFINNQRIRKSALKHGDEILIGKHTLVYMDDGGQPERPVSNADKTMPVAKLEETMVLDTKKRRELLQKATTVATEGSSPHAAEKVGCLTVLSGKTDNHEYILTSKLSMIGKSEQASIKLKGWFAPQVAAVITRKDTGYSVSPSGKEKCMVNGSQIGGPQDIKEGDRIEVAGITLQFYYRE